MARIRTYALDNNVTGSDYWIGTDGNDNSNTKNFSPNSVAKYLNENEIIDVSNSIRFRYDTIDSGQQRKDGTISFQNEIGATVPMSELSSFILSKKTQSGKDVSFFLNILPTTKVILHKADDINLFGLYKVSSVVTDVLEPNFFNVSLEFISGHGSIEEDKDYIISLIDLNRPVSILQLTKETFNYSSSSSFTLSNTIVNILQVIINATSLHPEGYSYTLPNTVNILNELYSGDVVTIVYNYLEEFFEVPDLQRVTNIGNHTTNNIVIDNSTLEYGDYTVSNTLSDLGIFQSFTSTTDINYQSVYAGYEMSINEIYSPTESLEMFISQGNIQTSYTNGDNYNAARLNSGNNANGPSLYIEKNNINGQLKIDNLGANITLQFPNKPLGTYTIATTSDVQDTALVFLDEGNGNGIVISGRNPLNYGNVGLGAVDFSISNTASSSYGATGPNSFAVGQKHTVSGARAFSIGDTNVVSGNNSASFGAFNSTSGNNSIISGFSNLLSGANSLSIGTNIYSTGDNSISIGDGVAANAYASSAFGYAVYSKSFSESVFGVKNTLYTPISTTSFNPLDRVFGVGNGDLTRSDAFIILKNGLATLPSVTNALIDADTTGKAVVTKEYISNIVKPYKVYTALLTQIGTSAPTATVLENTLGGTLVWSYSTTGVYGVTLSNAFTANKTIIFSSNPKDNLNFVRMTVNPPNFVLIYTYYNNVASENVLDNWPIEIRVYN